jgi:anti-sigma regulatory factor (Ser/Thr protein kinase)
MDTFKEEIQLTIPSDARYLRILRSTLESLAVLFNFDETDIRDITLAANEACSNIIRHAYSNRNDRPIFVTIRGFPDHLTIELVDHGKPLDPAKLQARQLTDVRPGGLGLHLIHTLADEVIYDTEFEDGNRIVLIKRRKSGHE